MRIRILVLLLLLAGCVSEQATDRREQARREEFPAPALSEAREQASIVQGELTFFPGRTEDPVGIAFFSKPFLYQEEGQRIRIRVEAELHRR